MDGMRSSYGKADTNGDETAGVEIGSENALRSSPVMKLLVRLEYHSQCSCVSRESVGVARSLNCMSAPRSRLIHSITETTTFPGLCC